MTQRGLLGEFRVEVVRMVRALATDRRAALSRARQAMGLLRGAILFRNCERGRRVNATGYVRVVAGGKISIGERVVFGGGMIPSEVICHPGAELAIGASSIVNYGVSLEATTSIRIGQHCMLGSMVRIRDVTRLSAAPVSIGDDVWIAHGAMVEPGVTVGDGSIISAGSVVTRDVPPRCLAIGNPARHVRLDMLEAAKGSTEPRPARPKENGTL